MAKIYGYFDGDGSLVQFSTFRSNSCITPVKVTNPIDLDKLTGYYIEDVKNPVLLFDEDRVKVLSPAQQEEEAGKQLEILREQLELDKIFDSVSKDDTDKIICLYPAFEIDHAYTLGDRFRWNGEVYQVLQDHTSAEVWKPDEATSLYKKVRGDES